MAALILEPPMKISKPTDAAGTELAVRHCLPVSDHHHDAPRIARLLTVGPGHLATTTLAPVACINGSMVAPYRSF